MGILKQTAVAVVLAAGTAGVANAHHAVNSQFDATKDMAFVGTLEKYELANPHTYVFFVRLVNGQAQHWAFETGAPAALHRAGLSAREAFKVGDTYTISYSPSRDGSYTGLMTAIKLKDGQVIAFGAAQNVDAAKTILQDNK